MADQEKILQVVVQLTRATVEGAVKWSFERTPQSLTRGTDEVIAGYLECKYKGQRIAVFERRYQAFNPENESFYWTSEIGLAFLDGMRDVLWDHRAGGSALFNLHEVAKESAAGVDDILNQLLDQS